MKDQVLTRAQSVRLLDVEPDLGAYLPADQRGRADQVMVPTRTVQRGPVDVEALLEQDGAFAAVILEGVLLHRVAIGAHPALRLLGPGDMLTRSGRSRSALIASEGHRATERLRLAILDDRVLLAACRLPRLFVGLQTRIGEQHQRLCAQLVICQLPRVEDRVLALMWLLAESWGRVTTGGTILPISLTHDALGQLVGARRPTVTLALKDLTARGALARRDQGWLLLQAPAHAIAPTGSMRDPQLLDGPLAAWRNGRAAAARAPSLDDLWAERRRSPAPPRPGGRPGPPGSRGRSSPRPSPHD